MRTTPKAVKKEDAPKTYDYKDRHGASPQEMPLGANDVPTVQAVVAFQFHGDEITTFEVDGEPYVAMRRIVENLGMDWGRQSKRLLEQEAKFNCRLMSTVGADGKRRDMLSIPLAKLPLWLASINPNKVPDLDARAKIELYQERSAVALYEFWFKAPAAPIHADLDADNRKVIGGIVKGVIHKELMEAVADVKAELQDMMDRANRRIGSLEYVPVLDVLKEHDIPPKGRRGLSQRCSALLRRYSLLHKFPMRESGETGRWLYHVEAIKAWVQEQGLDIFRRHKAKLAGDGELFRVVDGGKG